MVFRNEIKKMVESGENQKVEFKSKVDDGLGKSICSFANTNDGIILVGVGDGGETIGLDKKHEREIANISHTCKPSVYSEIETVEIDGKNIFVVKIKKSDSLHSFKNIAYKRIASHDKPLSPEEVIEFAKSSGKIRWDEQICEGASLENIDAEKVKWFLRKARAERNFDVEPETPVKEALERLELMEDGKPTNAAILLFGKNPQKFFLQAEARCARFKGTEPVKPFLDMKVFSGNIIDQIDKSLNFVLEHTPMKVYLVGKPEREERYTYPPDAIREAIVNAICHRDYEISSNVQVRIFDDRIEVWSCGKLPAPLKPENLKKKHKSILRNSLIGKCFFLIKFIERWGTGTNDMIKMCLGWELPEPLFEHVAGDFVVTFRKYRVSEDILEKLNERQKKALEYIKAKKEISNKTYRETNNIGKVIAAKELNELVTKKILKIVGKGRATKYLLND